MLEILDEVLTLIFFCELYACAVKMEVREQELKNYVKNVSVGCAISILFMGPQQIMVWFSSSWWKDFFALSRLVPSVTSLAITVVVIYCGCRVLIALQKSNRFHQTTNSTSSTQSKMGYLVATLVVTIIIQLLRFAARLTKLVFLTISFDEYVSCNELVVTNVNTMSIIDCLQDVIGTEKILSFASNLSCGLLEFVGIFGIMVYKKTMAK